MGEWDVVNETPPPQSGGDWAIAQETAPAPPPEPTDIGMPMGTPAQMGYITPQQVAQTAQQAIPTKEEAGKMLLDHTPEIAATLATLPIGGEGGPFVAAGKRAVAAGLSAAGAKLMLNEYEMTKPGSGMTMGQAVGGAGIEGAKQAGYGLFGEGVGGAIKGAGRLGMWLAEKSPAGRAVIDAIAGGARREALVTAKQIANQIITPVEEATIGGIGRQAQRDFERLAWEKSNSLASSTALAAEGHTLQPEGAKAMADAVKSALSKDEFAGNAKHFMTPLGDIDQRALDTWLNANEGNKEIYQIIRSIGEGKGKAVFSTTSESKAILKMEEIDPSGIFHDLITKGGANTEIPVAFAINFRKAVSQLSADRTAPEALQRIAVAIQGPGEARLAKLDNLILKSLPDDAAAKYASYLEFSRFRGNILQNAAYDVLQKDPNKIVDAIAPQRPDMAEAVKGVRDFLVQNGKPDIMPQLQRNWLEKQIEKGGIENFNKTVDSFGPDVLKNLFPDATGKATLASLREASSGLERRLGEVGMVGETQRQLMDSILYKATLYVTTGALGAAIGARGGAGGMATGSLAMIALPALAVAAAKGDANALQTMRFFAQKAMDVMPGPAVQNIIARRIANAYTEATKTDPAEAIKNATAPQHLVTEK